VFVLGNENNRTNTKPKNKTKTRKGKGIEPPRIGNGVCAWKIGSQRSQTPCLVFLCARGSTFCVVGRFFFSYGKGEFIVVFSFLFFLFLFFLFCLGGLVGGLVGWFAPVRWLQ
jgi:hypothetical protein